tara:strand:- start:83 stop:595 length:513 start_codon:yes stop_codon:yes gene_type:complete
MKCVSAYSVKMKNPLEKNECITNDECRCQDDNFKPKKVKITKDSVCYICNEYNNKVTKLKPNPLTFQLYSGCMGDNHLLLCSSCEDEYWNKQKEIRKRYEGKNIKLKCGSCGWIGFNNQAIYTIDRDGNDVLCCPIYRCCVEDFSEELECVNMYDEDGCPKLWYEYFKNK